MKRILSLAMVAVLLALPAWVGAVPLKVGDAAPDFSAPASDGSIVHLKDLIGKSHIVVYFYPKDDTPGCTKEACALRDDFAAFRGLNAVVFGVSFDPVESHKKFVEKHRLPFLLLADTDKKIALAYGAADEQSAVARRMTFLIGKDGAIAYVNPNVDPAAHSGEIQAALRKLSE